MPADDLSGGNRVVATYAQRLQARGHQVLVVSNAPDRPTLRERLRRLRRGEAGAFASPPAPQPGHVALSGVPQRTLERPRPIEARDLPDADVLVATWWETAVWMHRMPAAKGRRVHLIQDYESWGGPAERAALHAALRLPNLKVAISEGLRRTLLDALGELDVTVVPNAVDLERFDAPERERGAIPTVGFVYGRMPRKAADVYARACALARQKLPRLRVLAFGAETPTPEAPLPPDTEFFHRPPQDTLACLYARCDAWLFASRHDSFGLPILEAMACRTPVIGVPVGAAPELLADGAGVLVPPESPQAIADAIVALCSAPAAEWRRMSERAHARAHAWTWDAATDRLLQALAATTGETSR